MCGNEAQGEVYVGRNEDTVMSSYLHGKWLDFFVSRWCA